MLKEIMEGMEKPNKKRIEGMLKDIRDMQKTVDDKYMEKYIRDVIVALELLKAMV
jgi:hypothetical protein